MRDLELFVVNTRSIYLGDFEVMSDKLYKVFKKLGLSSYSYIDIPFKKIKDNNGVDAYLEMITGTLYYNIDGYFTSEDSIASFNVMGIKYYDDEKFGEFCSNYSLLLVKLGMKYVYHKERTKAINDGLISDDISCSEELAKKGSDTLKKLEKKHKNKFKNM